MQRNHRRKSLAWAPLTSENIYLEREMAGWGDFAKNAADIFLSEQFRMIERYA
jgi:hypothetical protein